MSLNSISEADLEIINPFSKDHTKETAEVMNRVTRKHYFYKKIVVDQGFFNESKLMREMCAVLTLNCKLIVKHFQVIESNDKTYFIFLSDFYESGNLEKEVKLRKKQKRPWTDQELWSIWGKLIRGFSWLEFNKCAHRAISPKNIIKCSEDDYKITNFHWIYDLMNRPKDYEQVGSRIMTQFRTTIQSNKCFMYMSPEMRALIAYNDFQSYDPFASDVYSLGLVFYYMASLEEPAKFGELADLTTITKERLNKLTTNNEIKLLLTDMLKISKESRPSFTELKSRHFDRKSSSGYSTLSSSMSMSMRNLNSGGERLNTEMAFSPENSSRNKYKQSKYNYNFELKKIVNEKEEKKKSNDASQVKKIQSKFENQIKTDEKEEVKHPAIKDVWRSLQPNPIDKIVDKPNALLTDILIQPLLKVKQQLDVRDPPVIVKVQNSGEVLQPKEFMLISRIEEIELKEPPFSSTHEEDWHVDLYKCIIKQTGVEAVAKKYLISPPTLHILTFESDLYEKLSSKPAFLKYFGKVHHENSSYIIIEYIQMTLQDYITDTSIERFNEAAYQRFTMILLSGFEQIEELHICHCDIKPENILITSDNSPKIIDFSSARIHRPNQNEEIDVRGTDKYLAPEIAGDGSNLDEIIKCIYDIARADAFSLGLTLLEFFLKEETFALNFDCNSQRLDNKIKSIPWKWAQNIVEILVYERCSMKNAYNTASLWNPRSRKSKH